VRVLVLDMGASSTIAAVIKLTPPAAPEIKVASSSRKRTLSFPWSLSSKAAPMQQRHRLQERSLCLW